ncbi:Neutral protease 2 [Apiospora hydei]|uniref:Neutral protease 2 n=1 Tax=Apiospora hydei TaxID=1337664 RepID=A0ABR1WNI7_9PEZI
MVPTRSLIALASIAATSLVNAHAIHHSRLSKRAPSPLEVKLTAPTGDVGEIVATITNVGAEDLNLLVVGTILDTKLPVERLIVSNEAGAEMPSKGIRISLEYEALASEHFELLKSGASLKTVIDGTSAYSFDEAGTYTFEARGMLPYALAPSTQLGGSAAYQSNILRVAVTGAPRRPAQALLPSSPQPDRRAKLQPGCSATEEADMLEALSNCQKLALAAAADAADPASKRFVEYFKTNASETRQTVVDRLTAVAGECATSDSGSSRLFCYDYYNICEVYGPLVAYSVSSGPDTMVVCPLYWERPGLTTECHKQDHATTILHETTHSGSIYSPKTNDYAYSYENITQLEPSFALNNADQYSLYANAVHLNC